MSFNTDAGGRGWGLKLHYSSGWMGGGVGGVEVIQ